MVNIQHHPAMTWCSESTSFLTDSYIQIYKKPKVFIGIAMNLVAPNDIPISPLDFVASVLSRVATFSHSRKRRPMGFPKNAAGRWAYPLPVWKSIMVSTRSGGHWISSKKGPMSWGTCRVLFGPGSWFLHALQ